MNIKTHFQEECLNKRISRGVDFEEAAKHNWMKLCKHYGFEPWEIEDVNGKWQDLCIKLAQDFVNGLKTTGGGRPKAKEDADAKIANMVLAHQWFGEVDQNGREIKPPEKTITGARKTAAKKLKTTYSKVRGADERYVHPIWEQPSEPWDDEFDD